MSMRKHLVRFIFSALLLAVALTMSGVALTPSAHAATRPQSSTKVAHHHNPVPASCPSTISRGSSGDLVKVLQSSLNALYLNFNDPRWFENSPKDFGPFTQDPNRPLAVDGGFGNLTFNAVWDYQSWNGLQVDGVVGPQTWGSLGYC